MSQKLQQARYDQLVRRLGALYGGGSKVTEVLGEVFPVLELENTTPEVLALSGWRTAWQSTQRDSGPGNVSSSQLFNPAGSGILAVVSQVIIRVVPTTAVQLETTTTILAGGGVSGLYRDTRFGTPRQTALQVRSQPFGAVGGGLRINPPDGVDELVRDENEICVLIPGSGLDVGTVGADILLLVNYLWRERPAQESELLFP